MIISTLATDVSVSATINEENMMDQHTPETQIFLDGRRKFIQNFFPSSRVSKADSVIRVIALRQKLTSKLWAVSRDRVTTPAVLHSRVINTINNTARELDIIEEERIA